MTLSTLSTVRHYVDALVGPVAQLTDQRAVSAAPVDPSSTPTSATSWIESPHQATLGFHVADIQKARPK